MNKNLESFIKVYNNTVTDCEVYTFFPRGIELQEEACQKLERLFKKADNLKKEFIEKQDEEGANIVLALGLMTFSLTSQMKMWIALKNDQPDKAWDHLVDAQESASGAMRAHPQLEHLYGYIERLHAIEKVVFPPQVFSSAGFLIRDQICSICQKDYDDCDHIVGRPYMGRLCSVIIKKWELEEVSIVDTPHDKRCRIIHFSDKPGKRNRMTWRIEKSEEEEKNIT